MRGFTTTGRAAMRGASKADAVAKSKPKTQRIRYRDSDLRLHAHTPRAEKEKKSEPTTTNYHHPWTTRRLRRDMRPLLTPRPQVFLAGVADARASL